ncbi:FAD dependent oxidoreductase [Legionella quinlivanii]|uniref:tRNA 5-methylaminomethyl-2-thiouridine biosynthesis bifunctional protein MnmC n=1 Tax=Legionella quinlivanii TaxID=45073 RepID=A0A0W0XTQ1_9GAMM|nr:bifunctional tRNA (5-methylaminomethyl-2-thiouridine)(34)-methyltransferase MnmD/FAD-dependent 5-carboxymethylaminomethyl-2-thiouridine(34) oxidoreductase MnmC [Legionella quinlivanii]KTD47996.1 FAD dependent oxidoreductase [Legionella quinlivanii]MCW8450722.1 bifunctional tRNA (5-methylaminomethyl-2-thiouridine)(34)-methyltransferase MnmD/FAD-dependent 5-carboxymethylaminomethyl-2-thiouridine(34) oxidoreductase MnmC [Legionella quinlivanii]SEG20876.1 tRNA 5-methylaminomethyl-2-thiouridine bi
MSNPFIPIETAKIDWQENTPYSLVYKDFYFPRANALSEVRDVFIEANDLIHRWLKLQSASHKQFCIGETGFGTALNFLTTWHSWLQYAPEEAVLYYYSCEKHPLSIIDLKKCLAQWPEFESLSAELISQYPLLTPGFHYLSFSEGRVKLILMLGEADSCFRQLLVSGDLKLDTQLKCARFDAWYFDGFDPEKNESMWSVDLFKVIALLSRPACTFATWSTESRVKDNLLNCGFIINKQKKQDAKSDMLSGELLAARYSGGRRSTPWQFSTKKEVAIRKAIIIGAGLAGAMTANALVRRGWKVTVLERAAHPAQGASGNSQAILYPQLSAFKSPLTDFMLMAYLYALRFYKQLPAIEKFADLKGIIQLAYSDKERKLQSSLKKWLERYPEMAVPIDAKEASQKAGIVLEQGGLFIPETGWIDLPELCRFLLEHSEINVQTETCVSQIYYENGCWLVNGQRAEVLVIANGAEASQFEQTSWLPLKRIKGQMTWIDESLESRTLTRPLCGDGHVLPARDGLHALGATFELSFTHDQADEQGSELNLDRLSTLAANVNWQKEVRAQWAGVRAAAPDYLPVAGPVPDAHAFLQRFAGLADDSKRWIAASGAYLHGLYLCSGFGSRGLTSVPVCAEWLAGLINNEPGFLNRETIRSLSAGRFLIKRIVFGKK